MLPPTEGMWYSKVHCVTSTPERDNVTETEEHHAERVDPFRALGTITERTHDDDEDKRDVQLLNVD